jgi:hypothetical protein
MANSISIVATNAQLLPSMYTSTITLHVPVGQSSATITTSPGTTFIDGSTSKTTTGYITVSSNPLNSNVWNIVDIFPYSNQYARVAYVDIGSIGIRSSVYVQGHTDTGSISTLGQLTTSSLTQQGISILSLSNLVETVNSLGNTYISSTFFTSTLAGLGSVYISSASLASTIDSIGDVGYISTPSIVSSIQGYSNYFTPSNLTSTVDGLGSNYISTASLTSTILGALTSNYTSKDSIVSTVDGLSLLERTSLVSTVQGLGSYYISSSALQSTIDNLGAYYVTSEELVNFVTTFSGGVAEILLQDMVINLGSSKYISTSQLTSTVSGVYLDLSSNVKTLGYISGADLSSTVAGLGGTYISSMSLQSTVGSLRLDQSQNMVSTVVGLGSAGYISSDDILTSLVGVSNDYSSQLGDIYSLMIPYISSDHLVSTVSGLGSLPGSNAYISTASLVSTTSGITQRGIQLLKDTAGQTYISTSRLVSTTTGLFFSNQITSTARGLGTYYISSAHLISTVNRLGSLPSSNRYISTASLVSTTTGYFNTSIQRLTNTAGEFYVSTHATNSTTLGLLAFSNQITSTARGLGTYYISSAHLVSTVNRLGSVPSSNRYISTASLVSTTTGYFNTSIQRLTNTAGDFYVSSPVTHSTTLGLLAFSNQIISTARGLGRYYISSAHLVSTVNRLGSLPGSNRYISTASLVSTTTGYFNQSIQRLTNTAGEFYVSSPVTHSTTLGLLAFSNQITSTARGLGTYYISSAELISTVNGLASLPGSNAYISTGSLVSTTTGYFNQSIQRLTNTAGDFYISSPVTHSTTLGLLAFSNQITSTATGLGTYYISSAHLVSTVNGLASLPGSNAYISTASLVSTTTGYFNQSIQRLTNTAGEFYISSHVTQSTTLGLLAFSNQITSTATGLGTYYISSAELISTVSGLGSLPGSNRYISTASLVSTYVGFKTVEKISLVDLVTNLGATYVSRDGLRSTTSNMVSLFSNALISSLNGLGSLPAPNAYISTPFLVTTVTQFLSNKATSGYMTSNLTIPESTDASSNVTTLHLALPNTPYFYISPLNLTSTTSGLTSNFSNIFTSTLTGLGTSKYISLAQLTSTVGGILSNTISPVQYTSTGTGYSNAQRSNLINLVNGAGEVYISSLGLVSTTTGILVTSNLTSTAIGLGTYYMSSAHLVSTVNGLGSLPGSNRYISSFSLTSTFTSLSNIFSASLLSEFENRLALTYISRGGIVSTITGLSNTYINRSMLTSTVNNLGQYYISTASLTSTIEGIRVIHSNSIPILLTSTVNGLGQIYLSTQRMENTITMSNSSNITSTVNALVAYQSKLNLYENGYLYSAGNSNVLNSSNFYEASNVSVVTMPMSVGISTIATGTLRTIGFGYMYGDGNYLTINSDRTLKEDIRVLSPARSLEQVLSLRGVHYKKKGDTDRYLGCIAQEIEPVFPEVITIHPSIEPKDLRSMKYEFLLAPLVQSVKELLHTHSTVKYFVQKKYGNIQ